MRNAKQLLRSLAVLAFLSFTLTSCNETRKEKPKQGKPEVLAPNQIVEVDQAKSMYDNYSARRVPLIQRYEDSINRGKMKIKGGDSKSFDVGRFVYYDYKTIKQYMDYIEQEAQAAGVEISTLRFYFSNYPDEQYFPGTEEAIQHPRQNSMILSPTIKKGKRDYLFYVAAGEQGQEAVILDDDFGTPKGMGLNNIKDNRSNASMIPTFFKPAVKPAYAGTSLTMNRGQGVPPYGQ